MAELESGGGDTGAVSSKLYLFTFLATLFLLLVVSTVIVVRSLIIRRRLERQIQEAIRLGLVATPRNPGSRRKKFTKKPKLHDAWIVHGGGETWDELMPLSVQRRIRACKSSKRPPTKPTAEQNLLSLCLHPRVPQAPSAELSDKPTTIYSPDVKSRGDKGTAGEEVLQVSLLVAMPRLPQHTLPKLGSGSEEEDPLIPEVSLGVVRLPFKVTSSASEDKSNVDITN